MSLIEKSGAESLEVALAELESEADALVRVIAGALKDAKRIHAAARLGQLRELRAAMDTALRSCDQTVAQVRQLNDSWSFDEQSYFAGGGYAKEVLALAAEEGVQAYESDERILSFPAIVQVSAADSTVAVDKKKERAVRPSVLVKLLKALQSRPPKFKAEAFLESLARAYDLVAPKAGGAGPRVVKLVDVYGVLTVMPGAAREYTKQEFARDLYLLDQSGVVTTRDGRQLRLPASALTRGSGVLTTVSRSGQEKVYAGISLEGTTP